MLMLMLLLLLLLLPLLLLFSSAVAAVRCFFHQWGTKWGWDVCFKNGPF